MDYVRDRPLDVAVATEMIRGIAKFGAVIQSDHCEFESMPDRSFSAQDLQFILEEGEVREPPKRDEKTGDYKYKMAGETIDGDPATAVVVITSHRSLCVVTVLGG
ncbi:MAG TPA: DUF4258 domain-containing protein [Syntrophobacteraceae bacterium]|nr:DUF4258 domain-containing protein [Syntrophobacteraceae bacterium]